MGVALTTCNVIRSRANILSAGNSPEMFARPNMTHDFEHFIPVEYVTKEDDEFQESASTVHAPQLSFLHGAFS